MITDYSSLKSTIADWLARSDLSEQIPTLIQLAEARMNRDIRTVDMQTEVSGTSASGIIAVPDDCIEIQSVRVISGGTATEMRPLPPESLNDRVASFPIGYVRINFALSLVCDGVSDYSYSMLYLQKIPALSDSVLTNWLLAKEPGAYLYASLIEAAPLIQDDGRILVWAKLYEEVKTRMKISDDNARYGNSPALRFRGYP